MSRKDPFERYKELLAKGICTHCAKEKAVSLNLCKTCADREAKEEMKWESIVS